MNSSARAHDPVVATQEWLDARWRYHLRLPGQFRAYPGPPLEPGRFPQLLARYERAEPLTTVEVRAAKLPFEVDAADWLASSAVLPIWASGGDIASESKGRRALAQGEWNEGEERWAGRFVAHKAGPRMFVIGVRTPRSTAGLLEEALERASFEPEHEDGGKFAEPLRKYGAATPIEWTTTLPASWIFDPGTRGPEAASFQAEKLQRVAGRPDELIGKLAFAVLARSIANTPRAVAALYLDALREHGLDVQFATVSTEHARRPFVGSWRLVAPVLRDTHAGEVHCRIACDERVWALGGVLSARREDHVDAWMQNKRALDLLFLGLRFKA
jgi:hypothetical protein